MPKQYRYKLAVQGAKNLTPIGCVYQTIREAREDAPRRNGNRKRDGLKLFVAIKVYRAGRWQFAEWLDDDDSLPDAPSSANPAPNPQGVTQEQIADYLETLEWEANYSPRGDFTFNQQLTAALAYDEWRYLLHSVDGLNV